MPPTKKLRQWIYTSGAIMARLSNHPAIIDGRPTDARIIAGCARLASAILKILHKI
jgi:hypothetical protein